VDDSVVAQLLRADPSGNIGGNERAVEELAGCGSSGNSIADGEGTGVANAVLANERPVGIRLVRGEGERELLRSKPGLGGRDGGGHVAGLAVCQDADRSLSVGLVGDGNAVVGTKAVLVGHAAVMDRRTTLPRGVEKGVCACNSGVNRGIVNHGAGVGGQKTQSKEARVRGVLVECDEPGTDVF
jgi:hypothetical protein